MELNRREAPLYGQVEVQAFFSEPIVPSEERDFYMVLEGSTLAHVAVARWNGDGCLGFTVPGHNIPEVVSVASYSFHEDQGVQPHGDAASLEYVSDLAQDVADYLHANRSQLEPQSHLELQGLVSSGQRGQAPGGEIPASGPVDGEGLVGPSLTGEGFGLRELDEKVTEAMANMAALQPWMNCPSEVQINGDGQSLSEAGQRPRETLLHLAARQDLPHLSRFLLHQPNGHKALTLPNQEGDTPLHLSQKSKEHTLFRVLTTPLVPASGHVVGGHCLWSDSSGVLRFHPATDQLTLSAPRAPGPGPDDIIAALRSKLGEPGILRVIASLSGPCDAGGPRKERGDQSDGDLCMEPGAEQPHQPCRVRERKGFRDPLELRLDEERNTDRSLLPVAEEDPVQPQGPHDLSAHRDHPESSDRPGAPPADPTPQRTAEQGGQHVGGATTDSSWTDLSEEDPLHPKGPPCATDMPPPKHQPLQPQIEQQPPPARLATPTPPAPPEEGAGEAQIRRVSLTLEVEDLSLVALELDSEEEGSAPPRPPFSDPGSVTPNGPGGTLDRSPDLPCTRTMSASSAGESASAQEPCDPGIRLRSYSYSYAKLGKPPPPCGPAQDSAPPGSSPEQRAATVPEPTHEKREVRLRALDDDEGVTGLTESLQHLTLSEFLKEIEEEEFDKYNIPSKTDSDKYKVIRTFSFLKSRMTSTRSKTKGKAKDKEAKERQLNGHQFATGSCLGPTVCLICEKPASGKDLLHCSRCMSMVHKGCKDSVPPCLKKPLEKYAVSMVKNRTASLPQNFTVRDGPPLCVHPNTMSLPVSSPKERREGALIFNPLSGSFSCTSDRQSESSEPETDGWRIFSQSDELPPTAPSSTSTDSSIGEDCVDSFLGSDLMAGALEFEAESWSLSVEHKFCKKQDTQEVKRQDVIYELMQTENHHLQTLHIMAEVFRRGVREEVQLDAEAQDRLFPCLDQLLCLHHAFCAAMRERRHSSAETPEQGNYLIQQIGDLLLHQFTDENAEKMKQVYGEFCSHHNNAVSYFKELQQNNKRFQNFVKQQSNNSLVRRREIPECILLVTQRITKYPVLLERILKYTQEATQEHADLLKALVQIREVIAAVDLRVSEYERVQRLQEVWQRTENRSSAKLKNGHVFRRQDMLRPGQVLKHQGPLLWKTATGRLKDVTAVLLTDTLIFLQEKDQKYVFAAVDQKPSVISLQKLIVREVANEERGMFLISASAAGPEMYEVHASVKDDRNTWMRLIREAVESCPEEEEDYTSESEDEKRAAEARVQKIHKLQEILMARDQQICSSLEEKLQIYAESIALHWKTDASQLEARIRVQPHPDEVPHAAVWLAAALQETENLKAMLLPLASPDATSDSVFPPSPPLLSPLPSPHPAAPPCGEEGEGAEEEGETQWPLNSLTALQNEEEECDSFKVAQSVQSLTQLLYTLQAAVGIQDSCSEVQRLLLSSSSSSSSSSGRGQRPPAHLSPSPSSSSSTSSGRGQRPPAHLSPSPSSSSSSSSSSSTRGPSLQEQEKQRNLEKRREEAAAALRLQGQLRLERQRWERECLARDGQQGALEARLEEREQRCGLQTERLRCERQELEGQLEEYQQSLERLRDGQRGVERERRRLDAQQKMLRSWRHGRMRSLPSMGPALVIPLGEKQLTDTGQPGDYKYGGSVFVNEAALAGTLTPNNHHKRGDPSAHNSLNALLVRSNQRQQAGQRPAAPATGPQNRVADTGFFYQPSEPTLGGAPSLAGGEDGHTSALTSPGSGGQYTVPPLSLHDPPLDLDILVSMETENEGEEAREENIVYL